MARQKSIIKLKGNIGDITFYKTKDGFGSREKGGIDGKRIATDPKFQRVRENNKEFGRAIAAGKLIRVAFGPLLRRTADGSMANRLSRELMRVIKADSSSLRGQRNVMNGVCGLLERFVFNADAPFNTVCTTAFDARADRALGKLFVDIPPFVPMESIVAPQGATHFRFISGGAEVDFDAESHIVKLDSHAEIPIDQVTNTGMVRFIHDLTPNTVLPMFLVLGIEFVQVVNGVSYPLTNGLFNSLSLVKVDQL